MTRRTFIWCGSLLVPSVAMGQAFTFRDPAMKTNQTAAGCTGSLQQTVASASGITSNLGDTSGHTYGATKFTASASYTTCRVDFNFIRFTNGSAAGTLTGYIWADNSGVPGTLLATSTNTVASASVSTGAAADYTFNFSGLSLTNATIYWVGLSAGTIDANNAYQLSTGALNSGTLQQSSNGSSWSQTGSRGIFSKVYA